VYYIFQSKNCQREIILEFRIECRSFIQAVLSKLQEKSPLKYTFAQKLSCLNSKGMATENSEANITAFRALVRHLNEANRVAEGDADFITLQEIPGGGSSSEQV